MTLLSNEDLSKVKIVELEILKEFLRIVEENNLKYYLGYGSLLGAIRHNGFVPWDDDIDINMPREDFNRFSIIVQKNLKYPYKYSYYKVSGKFEHENARLINPNVFLTIADGKQTKINACIDIASIDGSPNGKISRNIFFAKRYCYRFFRTWANIQSILDQPRKKWKDMLLKIMRAIPIEKILDEGKIYTLDDSLSEKYSVDKSLYIGTFQGYGRKEYVPKEYFGYGRLHIFENIMCSIPEKAEEYLSSMYGDYMKLPPEERRRSHFMKIEILE